MNRRITHILADFSPISLEGLNTKAQMLERLDNKYIVPADRMISALQALNPQFDVLEIDDRRSFRYATQYFDDAELRAYYDHHQGRRKRCKVRIRNYVDAGFSFLEVKLKDKRQITVKKRLKLAAPRRDLGVVEQAFVEDCYREMYGARFGKSLAPAIEMQYERITLVAKQSGERLTIDTSLWFRGGRSTQLVSSDLFIVETKSERGNGLADKVLRGLHIHPTKRCSKYCIGMAATGQVALHNRFLPGMRRLGLIEPAIAQNAVAGHLAERVR